MSYGQYKRVAQSDARPLPPPRPLTPAQRARAEAVRADWLRHFHGDASFIKALVDAGLIHGWRDVVCVTPISEDTPDAPA